MFYWFKKRYRFSWWTYSRMSETTTFAACMLAPCFCCLRWTLPVLMMFTTPPASYQKFPFLFWKFIDDSWNRFFVYINLISFLQTLRFKVVRFYQSIVWQSLATFGNIRQQWVCRILLGITSCPLVLVRVISRAITVFGDGFGRLPA